jgi:5-methylcytosine-specific restriction endonuclease McrA
MRFRSLRMQRRYVARRALVATLLDEHRICQRCGTNPSSEIHELLSRARGGSITNEGNCVALCGRCHHWITEHPAAATAEGWLEHSWEAQQ